MVHANDHVCKQSQITGYSGSSRKPLSRDWDGTSLVPSQSTSRYLSHIQIYEAPTDVGKKFSGNLKVSVGAFFIYIIIVGALVPVSNLVPVIVLNPVVS